MTYRVEQKPSLRGRETWIFAGTIRNKPGTFARRERSESADDVRLVHGRHYGQRMVRDSYAGEPRPWRERDGRG